ncbi:serine/threonine protein kinase [Saprolegnia diclina VS20]|uniref:Serine/threonine protein kinase n=1 Tax=Saprolegnia diclina (strain VS20) TaxID=1156394 RepID=T0PMN0_SAPDV|nr:serine/threonine protein kinase [Saprolegnia diclina VS20]EQC26674.1 serine/threonine protein kinase [Saprolegnia diclina VS20]|eukprot:XP_008619909.1 serine/threonine protein kinase [Saprolegnia diclina VS20]
MTSTETQYTTALLLRAVASGDTDDVSRLLDKGADITAHFPDGLDLLAMAVRHGHDQLARVLHDRMYPSVASVAATDVRFEGLDRLDSGRFYEVQKGVYNDAPVAVKQPHHFSPRSSRTLREDAQLQKTIRSPYVLPLLATVDLDSKKPQLITEFMDQGNVLDYLRKKREGEHVAVEVTTVQVAWVIANALQDLHRQSIIHRNVESRKVLLSTTHGVKFSGFTYARTVVGLKTANVGTMLSMAPEVLRRDYEEEAASADIYSFGVVLTELDKGNAPYANSGDFSFEMARRVGDGSLRPTMSPNCVPWLRELADRCLAADPAERPTASDIVAILAQHLDATDTCINVPPAPSQQLLYSGPKSSFQPTMETTPTLIKYVQSSASQLRVSATLFVVAS